MIKRVIAFAVVASLALGSGGCTGNSGQDAAFAVQTAPLWIPAALIWCATGNCKGSGISSNLGELRTTADKGDAHAQWILGGRYLYGYGGVSADDAKAAHWYRRSAKSGYEEAQLSLARLYEWGRGVPADDIQADMWYSIAISNGRAYIVERSTEEREDIEKRMTPEQIAEARRRAAEWKPSTNGITVFNGTTP